MTAPRVLLIYANPAITAQPVPPYGMERIAQAFQLAGCEVVQSAPFIEAKPLAVLKKLLAASWDLVGFSVRNIDDALVVRSTQGESDIDLEFYLDLVKPLVEYAVAHLGQDKVLLGGTAIGAGPVPVTRYLGARFAISGPAGDLCWRIGRSLVRGEGVLFEDDPRVVDLKQGPKLRPRHFGANAQLLPAPAARLGPYLGLTIARGSRVPVALDAGCDRRCNFCVEASFLGHSVVSRSVDHIVLEMEQLAAVGVRKFWLATSELNVPNDRKAIELLKRIAGKGWDLMTFLQVAPVSHELLDALEGAGVDPTTLSFEFGHLDDELLRKGAGPANLGHIDALADLWLERGYDTLGGSILLGAHPEESWDSIDRALEKALQLDSRFSKGLGLAYATGARVYPETELAAWIRANREAAQPHLYGDDDPEFVRPVVFSRPTSPRKLLGYVERSLRAAVGEMGPMNAEAPADKQQLAAEALVNRGIWRSQEGLFEEAAVLLEQALNLQPAHFEALSQLAQLQANCLDQPQKATLTLLRLRAALPSSDHRRAEIEAQLGKLGPQ